MKKQLFLLLCVFFSITATAQTLSLNGASTGASGQNILLTFSGETSSRWVSSVSVDIIGSTYNGNYVIINPVSGFQSGAGGTIASKFNVNVVYRTNTHQTNETVTIKFNYSYNGIGGAGQGVLTKSFTITPPPPPVVTPDPNAPTTQQLSISLEANDQNQPLSPSNFHVNTMGLLSWTIIKGIPASACKVYAQASSNAQFSTIKGSFELITYSGFTNGLFPNQGFSEPTYLRYKLVYNGRDYYSNTLFVF